MFVIGLGTAVPATQYTQAQCWEALRASCQFPRLTSAARALLERVLLGDNGIRTRHLALGSLEQAFDIDPDSLHARFAQHAPALATEAAVEALQRAGIEAREIDALLISTCTGYLCPGLTSYVGEALGVRGDVLALDLVGQGCGAALPNLRAAEALVASGRCSRVLSICVEVCSAALYIDNDPGVLVSGCLFGDGAAAAVLSGAPGTEMRCVKWHSGHSWTDPAERDALRMEQRDGMLRNVLSRQVPALAAEHAKALLEQALQQQELGRHDVRTWIWHAGGRLVLERLRQRLELDPPDVQRSADVLSRFGNLSSAFVLFVLRRALEERAPAGWWWMSSFGAGFSCHGALLSVQ